MWAYQVTWEERENYKGNNVAEPHAIGHHNMMILIHCLALSHRTIHAMYVGKVPKLLRWKKFLFFALRDNFKRINIAEHQKTLLFTSKLPPPSKVVKFVCPTSKTWKHFELNRNKKIGILLLQLYRCSANSFRDVS